MLAFGGVHERIQVVLFGLLACALGTLATMPDEALGRANAVNRWVVTLVAVTVALGTGFLPLPEGVRRLVADDARTGWSLVSFDPERTVSSLTLGWWLVGVGVATSITAVVFARRRWLEWAVLAMLALVLAVGTGHWFGKAEHLFGSIPMKIGGGFAAPFIDRNHFGSFLLLGVPLVVDWAADDQRNRFERAAAGVLGLWTFGMLFVVHSVAPVCIALGQLLWLGLTRRGGLLVLAAAGPVIAAGTLFWSLRTELSESFTLHGRLEIWRAALAVLQDHWLFGAGGGTFGEVVQAYRTDTRFEVWDHVHQDYLEALVDTGLVGALMWGVVAVALRPRRARDPKRSRWIDLGVIGVLLHALVEFPLEIPALAGGVVALWAVRQALHEAKKQPGWPRLTRGVLVALVVLEVAGGAWAMRTEQVARTRERLRENGFQADAVKTLKWLAPWSPELVLVQAWRAENVGNRTRACELALEMAAAHPADPDSLRDAAAILGRAERTTEAVELAERAVHLSPSDWRPRVVLAILLTPGQDADRAVSAWRDAIRVGAPPRYYEFAWRLVPVGVAWTDAVPDRYRGDMGAFLVRKKDHDSAAIVFEQALLGGAPPSAYPEYVDLLLIQGRLDEADRITTAVLDTKPLDRQFRVRLARVREAQERWLEASEVWEALAVTAHGVREAAPRAVLCAERGAGARRALETARRLRLARVAGPAVTLEEGRILREAGDPTACIEALITSGYVDDERFGARIRKELERCRRARSAAGGSRPPQEEQPAGEEGDEGHPVP